MQLSTLTTLELGGAARRFVVARSNDALIEVVRDCDERGEPVFILGGGSNVVFADAGYDGTVVHVATRGLTWSGDVVHVAAGESWDDVVAWAVRSERRGIECLSGIPGLAGATPIQNVGAYGQEIRDTLVSVRAWDRSERRIVDLTSSECRFSYRHSALKETARWVVLRVSLMLERASESAPIRYAELARALGIEQGRSVALATVRAAVLALRSSKGMVLDPADSDSRSAGSFFTNPIMDDADYQKLSQRAGEHVPRFDEGSRVKVPAAWLIEHAGFGKGHARGHVGISSKHALALTNRGGASARELLDLAREIRDAVERRYGVTLAPEPVLVGCSL